MPTALEADVIGWGVVGPGAIAHSFARDLSLVADARLAATGSRSTARAEAFAAQYGGRAHGSYADLVADPAVDIVYVASPHALHEEHVELALDAGKPVLCEKPLALDAATAQRLFDRAEAADLFLMEAMWTACHPVVRHLLALLRGGEYGEPRQVHADLGFVVPPDAASRMFDPALGASALLDMGIYPLTFAQLLLGEPDQLRGVAVLDDRGVDDNLAIAGRYGAATAALTASMTSLSPRTASVATTAGRFDLPENFHHPTGLTWTPAGGARTEIATPDPVIGRGYGNEIAHVHHCLRRGLQSSPWVPPEQTVSIQRQMDDLRVQFAREWEVSAR